MGAQKAKKKTNVIRLNPINLYRHRSNLDVLKNKITHELNLLETRREKELKWIEKRILITQNSTDETGSGWIGDIATMRSKKRKLEQLEHEKEITLNNEFLFEQQVSQLKPDNVASLILFSNITGSSNTEVFESDSTRCNKCGNLYKINIRHHTNECLQCKRFVRSLFVMEDVQTDSLAFKNHKTALLLKNENVANVKKPRSCADKRVSYLKYLNQFAEDAPQTPLEVNRILFLNFSFIHIFNGSKCRAASVASVLKENNCEKEYISCAIRIARELNNEPVPKLSQRLIEACVVRFEEISFAVSTLEHFDKLPSLEILTHTFLRAEREDALANMFSTHKASPALRSADVKMRELIEICRKLPSRKSNWENIPRGG